MNFLAAVLYVAVKDEVIAYEIMKRIMMNS